MLGAISDCEESNGDNALESMDDSKTRPLGSGARHSSCLWWGLGGQHGHFTIGTQPLAAALPLLRPPTLLAKARQCLRSLTRRDGP